MKLDNYKHLREIPHKKNYKTTPGTSNSTLSCIHTYKDIISCFSDPKTWRSKELMFLFLTRTQNLLHPPQTEKIEMNQYFLIKYLQKFQFNRLWYNKLIVPSDEEPGLIFLLSEKSVFNILTTILEITNCEDYIFGKGTVLLRPQNV